MAATGRDIIVLGASAGGLQALQMLVSLLPKDLPAALFIVQHTAPEGGTFVAEILNRNGPLPAFAPKDNSPIEHGRIYVAPADCHMLVETGRVRVVRGPPENRHRPSIDPLFRSAAWAYGPRVVGVVLSGYLDDGTAGLWAVKSCGGIAIVQDPLDAVHPDMPRNAALEIEVDYTLPVADIAPLLVKLSQEKVERPEEFPRPKSLKTEIEFAKMDRDITDMSSLGMLSPFTCPTCHGALWELEDGDILRYRCHTGHAFSRDSLIGDQSTAIEEALYSALRAVEEKATALRRLGERFRARSPGMTADYQSRAAELDDTANVLRDLLSGEAA